MIKLAGALVLLAACGADRPATLDEAVGACHEWSRRVETKYAECLGWDQAMLDRRIAEGQAQCWDELGDLGEGCAESLLATFDGCAERVADRSCADLCTDQFCFTQCFYACPSDP